MRKMISSVGQVGFIAGLFGALAMRSAGVEYHGEAWAAMWVSLGLIFLSVKPKDIKPPAK